MAATVTTTTRASRQTTQTLAEILDLDVDHEVDLTGLATEIISLGLDLNDPATHHHIAILAEPYTHQR